MTLDEIAELERLLAATVEAAPAPWEADPQWPEVQDARGEWVADAAARDARLIAAARNALPDLLALARRALETEGGPNENEVCAIAAAECDALADEYETAGDISAADACRECGDRIEGMDVRELFRVADAGGAA